MSTNNNQGNNNQGNSEKNFEKAEKNFAGVIKKLAAIVGGEDNLALSNKVNKDEISGIVADLFKEEREANKKQFKEDLKTLLKKHAEFKKTVAEEEAKFKKSKAQKQQEFVKAANNLLKRADDLSSLIKEYESSLGEATSGVTDSDEE